MKKIKFIVTIFIFLFILFVPNSIKAYSYYGGNYSIEKVDMQITLQEDGSLNIDQTLKYNFDGKYYDEIQIPIFMGIDESEYDELREETKVVENKLYFPSGIEINNVLVDGELCRKRENSALSLSGNEHLKGSYSIDKRNNINVYVVAKDEAKSVSISYTLKNVAVKHRDIGEIYCNFISKNFKRVIKELDININLPNNKNKESLYVYVHGATTPEITIVDKNNIHIHAKEVRKTITGRVLFEVRNIMKSNKATNKIALESIKSEEKKIYDKLTEGERVGKILIVVEVILLIYWLMLILKYENDKKYDVSSNDEEMFDKYNPLLAGCIQGSRNVLSRDIIAVIIDLVNKKYFELDLIPMNKSESDQKYIYIIRKNKKSTYELDEIENYIVKWIYMGEKTYNTDGEECINLLKALEELPKSHIANRKFKELNKMARKELNKRGANKAKVPYKVKVFNILLFIVTIILSGWNFYVNMEVGTTEGDRLILTILQMPKMISLMFIVVIVTILIIKPINKIIQRINSQKIVVISLGAILGLIFIIILTMINWMFNYMLLINEILMGTGLLIVLTDKVMLKNDAIMIEDYSRLNALKSKIKNYSIMQNKEIKDVILWERYLSYAISFGLANKITNKIKLMIEDDILNRMLDNKSFFDYVVNDYNYFNKERRKTMMKEYIKRHYMK